MCAQSEVYEVNFDGLIGPTHNFSGLSYGNIASLSSQYQTSSPKQAALQGLKKMKLLHSLGVKQGFIPPQERPCLDVLRENGFQGKDSEILEKASQQNEKLFLSCCSASSMWCANAATVSPSLDTKDGKVHITVANLITHQHRAIEANQTTKILNEIFAKDAFIVHQPMTDHRHDDGAANHMRFSHALHQQGINVFVYGVSIQGQRFPSRQSRQASEQIINNHNLNDEYTFIIEQNSDIIQQGVFHNDVIAVSHENVFLFHEEAFKDSTLLVSKVNAAYRQLTGEDLFSIEIMQTQLNIQEAVETYFFNSQIVTLVDGNMIIIAPMESSEGRPRVLIDEIIRQDNPISDVHFVDLRESMANGGGPACLRLRVVLTPDELAQVNSKYLLDDKKFKLLEEWINIDYRETLHIEELKSPELLKESQHALDELTKLLNLGKIYSFQ